MKYCIQCLKSEKDCSCISDYLDMIKHHNPVELTPMQKLNAFAYRFYNGTIWIPKKFDYYTSTRADLELYQIVEISEDKIKTKYCHPNSGDNISEWNKETFLTEGFGVNRLFVPLFILK